MGTRTRNSLLKTTTFAGRKPATGLRTQPPAPHCAPPPAGVCKPRLTQKQVSRPVPQPVCSRNGSIFNSVRIFLFFQKTEAELQPLKRARPPAGCPTAAAPCATARGPPCHAGRCLALGICPATVSCHPALFESYLIHDCLSYTAWCDRRTDRTVESTSPDLIPPAPGSEGPRFATGCPSGTQTGLGSRPFPAPTPTPALSSWCHARTPGHLFSHR